MRRCLRLLVFAVLAAPPAPLGAEQAIVALTDGSILKGEVSRSSPTDISLTTSFGVTRIPLDKIDPECRRQLGLGADAAALQARVAELEADLERLRAENALLRRQLTERASAPAAPVPQSLGTRAVAAPPAAPAERAGGYWISSTGKRHNPRCRYYRTCNGHEGGPTDGVACKICGG